MVRSARSVAGRDPDRAAGALRADREPQDCHEPRADRAAIDARAGRQGDRVKTSLVVGAGAIGTFLGTHLARSGSDGVALARGRPPPRCGPRVPVRGGRRAAHRAGAGRRGHRRARTAGPGRARGEGAVAAGRSREKIRPLLGPDTMVLTAMNGVPWWFFQGSAGRTRAPRCKSVDPDGRIAAAIPMRHVIGCVVHATCSVREPGLVRHGFGRGLIIGEPRRRRVGPGERAGRSADRGRLRGHGSASASRPTSGTSSGAT